ncbi:MAG: crossover junction endodeoxyribonuclease RuvC [Dictyoglomus sp. NZ13-RE01]|nr:MAG: crossover junction endodeoxyribonuclease RuvC [Dictyoglomus sp. NZ13-RE01]
MLILGIDPGTATIGYGLVDFNNKKLKIVDYGVLTTPKEWVVEKRLNYVYMEISNILEKYNPDVVVMENVYFYKNTKTAINVAQAQGVIMLSTYQHNIKLQTFTPLEVKQTIVGYGRATKEQMQIMVKELLQLEEIPKPDDAADALALCICYSLTKGDKV